MTPDAAEVETVSGITLRITPAEPSPQAQALWGQRVEALATWLAAEWQRAHGQAGSGGGDRHQITPTDLGHPEGGNH